LNIRSAIIIGAGPAGLTAGIYLGRAGLKPLVVTGTMPGGQLTTTTEIENYPGFPKGLPGPQLMESMEEQARHWGAEILLDEVTALDTAGPRPAVMIGPERLEAHALILATGASPRTLGIASEKAFWSAGVHTCAVCDGSFYRGREVAIVGGGDSAAEEASYLAKVCGKVTLIHRRDQLRASRIMQERILANPKITVRWNSTIDEYLGEERGGRRVLAGLRLRDTKTGELSQLAVAACFLAIGHVPNTNVFRGHVALDEEGYVIVDERLRTNREGIFAAGDVHDRRYRQAITAAGFGCQAALETERYLTEKGAA